MKSEEENKRADGFWLFHLVHRLRRRRGISIKTTTVNLMMFIIIVEFTRNTHRYVMRINKSLFQVMLSVNQSVRVLHLWHDGGSSLNTATEKLSLNADRKCYFLCTSYELLHINMLIWSGAVNRCVCRWMKITHLPQSDVRWFCFFLFCSGLHSNNSHCVQLWSQWWWRSVLMLLVSLHSPCTRCN